MRCKNCKELFEVKRFNSKYCDKLDCKTIEAMQNLEKLKQKEQKDWSKRKKEIKKGMETVQELMKITQVTFNKYIRLRDKGLPCISCGVTMLKKINACHYYSSGGHKALTFNTDNVHSGCERCNSYLAGNLTEYRKGLIERIGIESVERLDELAHETRKYSREELRELNEYYKQKIKEL